jgi:hypothetical protein
MEVQSETVWDCLNVDPSDRDSVGTFPLNMAHIKPDGEQTSGWVWPSCPRSSGLPWPAKEKADPRRVVVGLGALPVDCATLQGVWG